MPAFPSNAKLTGVVQAFKPGVATPAARYFTGGKTDEKEFEFHILQSNRGKTDFRNPDSVAGVKARTARVKKRVQLACLREKVQLEETTIRWCEAPGKDHPELAEQALTRELRQLDDIFERTWEWARWQILTTGGYSALGEESLTYDFGLTNTVSAGVEWDLPATATPIANINAWKVLIEQTSGYKAAELLITSPGLRLLMATSEAKALFSDDTKKTYFETGKIGKIADLNVILVDDGWDNAGTFNYYLSTSGAPTLGNMAIIKAAGPVGQFVQGKAIDSKAPDRLIGKFAKTYVREDPPGRTALMCQTASPGLTEPGKVVAATLWT